MSPKALTMRRLHNDTRGAALVESVLSIILLVTMIFGITELGFALYTYHYIAFAAREGTRYAIVRGSACNTFTTACPASTTQIQNYVLSLNYPGIDTTKMLVTASFPTTGSNCTPSVSPCNNPGNVVKVVVTYQFPLASIFIPSATLPITTTSQMVISQ
ncbi:MAG: pilus assembly protein [Acidobacteriota bacterium]|nr:pilus assembly protein [Acidobacteriota bacterium]